MRTYCDCPHRFSMSSFVRATRAAGGIPLLAVFLLHISSGAAYAQPTSKQDVERVVTEFLAPFSNRDVVKFMAFFSDDATVFFPPSAAAPLGRVRGRTEIERTFKAIFEKYPPRAAGRVTQIQPQDLLVEVFDGFAVATFHLGTETARQRRTLVLRPEAGEWRIVHLHGSAAGDQPTSR
jgi:uncharacterized protein (TIGR02246 family)